PHVREQHLIQNLRVVAENGVEVFVPPLHSQVVTASLQVDASRRSLAEARTAFERELKRLDDEFPSTPAGLAVTVGWGLPYFDRYVPGQARRLLAMDVRASGAAGHPVRVLEPAAAFPSDPDDLILEANDVAILLRSDSLDRIAEGAHALVGDTNG